MSVSHKPHSQAGKVNVALGDKEVALGEQAQIAGTSKTNLARVLILDGIKRLESGAFHFKPPAIEAANDPDQKGATA